MFVMSQSVSMVIRERRRKGRGLSCHDSPCGRNRNATYKVTHGARDLDLSLKPLGEMIEKLRMPAIHKVGILSINIIFQFNSH